MEKAKAKLVEVQIKDIVKNPLRDFKTYSYQEHKLVSLIESINETDFWEGVIGRRKGKTIEIAFGHHRVKAAERVYGKEGKITIIVKPLSDDMMRKMMVRENKEEWGCLPAAIDDAVKASRDHLMKDREHAKKTLSRVRPDVKRVRVGAPAIAKDTGYPVSTVELSLRRLDMIEKGEVDREAIYKMPHQEAARRFAHAILYHRLSVDQQRLAAEKIAEEGKFGAASIEQMIDRVKPLPAGHGSDPRYAGFYDLQLRKATSQIKTVIHTLEKLYNLNETPLMGVLPTDEDISEVAKDAYNQMMTELVKRHEIVAEALERKPEHGKSIFDEETGELTEKEPALSEAGAKPSPKQLKDIHDRLEKVKARLKEKKFRSK